MTRSLTKPDLHPGDWVRVKSAADILATLGPDGTLDGLPFMPEMVTFCGQRYQVGKRVDKACILEGMRRFHQTVLLELTRCDGEAHGGCDARCPLLWKEAWLELEGLVSDAAAPDSAALTSDQKQWLWQTATRSQPDAAVTLYRCQATEFERASTPLPWYELTQYVRDVHDHGIPVRQVIRTFFIALYNRFCRRSGRSKYPNVTGTLKRTPREDLHLQPGEEVDIKSREEIVATLNSHARNRGLDFDCEMIPFCNQRMRVLNVVKRVVDEHTGELLHLRNRSVVLDGSICQSYYRRGCARSGAYFWREIWLRRVHPASSEGEAKARSDTLTEQI